MKSRGKIISFIPDKGGYGIIDSENEKGIRFEKVECNYKIIRKGDYVEFELFKCNDGQYDALNIEFIKNETNRLINQSYLSQTKIECNVISKTKDGYILDYNDYNIFIFSNNISSELVVGTKIFVYINSFSEGGIVSASFEKNINFELHSKYDRIKKDAIPLKVNITEINIFGLVVSYDSDFGFIPNIHIEPLKKDNLKLGEAIYAIVISNSIKKGLIFSVRNYEFNFVLDELSEAYKNNSTLIGEVNSVIGNIYKVNFKGVLLMLNKKFIINENNLLKSSIPFKVVDFQRYENISISNIEATDFALYKSSKKNNLFTGFIKEITESGFIIYINEKYNFAFLPFNQISDSLYLNFDYNRLKIGSKINFSILNFNYKIFII